MAVHDYGCGRCWPSNGATLLPTCTCVEWCGVAHCRVRLILNCLDRLAWSARPFPLSGD
jgi:hypothetical protein